MRYTEEVELLLEEMRRVLAFLKWDRDRWMKRAAHTPERNDNTLHPGTSTPTYLGKTTELEEGLKAYALRQAFVRQHLFETFSQQWHDVPSFIRITDEGLENDETGRDGGG